LIQSTEKFWESVYSRNIGKLIGICYRYTGNRQLSEDLAHDAFLKAIEKSESFEGKGAFEAWLRKIVVNHVLQYIRYQKKKKHIDDHWLKDESTVVVADTEDLEPNSNSEISEKELLDAVNNLPEHHRLVFNLYVIDNFTHAHIGEMLGISAGTSKSHLARARKKLQQLLEHKTDRKSNRKKAFLVFLLSTKHPRVDLVYKERFNNLELHPDKVRLPNFGNQPAPLVKLRAITSWSSITMAASVGIILTTIYILSQQKNDSSTPLTARAQSGLHYPAKNGRLALERETTDELAKNLHIADSKGATILPNSIIPYKNLKNKRMKILDSLGAMLLVSSSIVVDTTAQLNNGKDFSGNTESQSIAQESLTIPVDTEKLSSAIDSTKTKKQPGTFSATSLFWSAKNNELYMKGSVRVNIGRNNFVCDGSVSFLGPVYLLAVNGTPVTLNSTIKLSKQPYYLTSIGSREATQKYGEKGQYGAVEISQIE
jgi:RNA polymerase sigma factor (sigma-70 family)